MFRCSFCPYQFLSRGERDSHENNVHYAARGMTPTSSYASSLSKPDHSTTHGAPMHFSHQQASSSQSMGDLSAFRARSSFTRERRNIDQSHTSHTTQDAPTRGASSHRRDVSPRRSMSASSPSEVTTGHPPQPNRSRKSARRSCDTGQPRSGASRKVHSESAPRAPPRATPPVPRQHARTSAAHGMSARHSMSSSRLHLTQSAVTQPACSSVEPLRHECDHCAAKFTRPSHMQAHVNNVHKKLRPYVCEVCRKTFGWAQSLARHRRVVHQLKQ
ncbi:hypothetical protein BWQ96_01206 [Gracilariopsis chorda]|uniref:C2H2-type domain-containing protein n=1 Tax=Gracilariopsis chorda TaxID=448386 RepID=A0A2V3J3T0_9FLOR|nr:hypothetical protein BWQ96_01206 [Gracilariopsis chorda]|eukprot:PXF49068.1 hypothetical protein BWQ96_01206 [Gracilariopsis chorda]